MEAMMFKKVAVTLSILLLAGCQAKVNDGYRIVNDKAYMYKVEKMAEKSASPNRVIWVNPPKKKVKDKN